ncbi:MAG: hypothetical protein EPN84_04505 [Legionella sp.]|nr:MAG: hypothetical protein EPN84_04505 [Legionella sp.]
MPQPLIAVNVELKQILDNVPLPSTPPNFLMGLVNEQGYVPIDLLIERIKGSKVNLDLSQLPLNKFSEKDLVAIFNAFPSNLLELNLSDTHFGELPPALAVELLKKLPKTLISLKLNANNLNKLSHDLLRKYLSALPSLKRLELKDNDLDLNYPVIVYVFNSLPRSLVGFNYAGNNLNKFQFMQLVSIFDAFPPELAELDLHGCLKLPPRDLLNLFRVNVFYKIVKLDLADNELGELKYDEAKALFTDFSKLLTTLGLKNNSLGNFNALQLKILLRSLPSLLNLDLSENHLSKFTCAEFVELFRALPKSLETLRLSRKDIEYFSPAELFTILSAAPKSLKRIYLDDVQINIKDMKKHLLQYKIDQEMLRLDRNKSTVLNIMGITSYPMGETIAFKKLKRIIEEEPSEFRKDEMRRWHKEYSPIFAKSVGNKTSFFSTAPEKRSEKLLNEIYEYLEYPEPKVLPNLPVMTRK